MNRWRELLARGRRLGSAPVELAVAMVDVESNRREQASSMS